MVSGKCRSRSRHFSTIGDRGNSRIHSSRQQQRVEGTETACLIGGYNTFRGSMPNFFMREISVVRLMSMRAAAPSGPATRPLVTFRIRRI